MYSLKKANNDLFLILLLLIRLGLDPDEHVAHRWNQQPEIRSVFSGPTSAYTQITLHSPYSGIRYPHPKSLEYNEIDEATSLFSRMNFYDTLRARRGNLIACISNSPLQNGEENNSDNFGRISMQTSNPLQSVNSGSSAERETALELSPEDMDLIEILWKQDIDLGVSRDAYDLRQRVETEKLKDIELIKEEDVLQSPDLDVIEEASIVPNVPSGLNYTIDSETGECVIDDFSELSVVDIPCDEIIKRDAKFNELDLLAENDTLCALSEDSYLPFDASDDFCNLTEVFSPNQLTHLLNEDISSDSDYLSQIEDLENELKHFEHLSDASGTLLPSDDVFSNIDDWPDASTVLPLLALSKSSSASPAAIPLHSLQSLNSNNSSLPSLLQTRTNESFLQSIALESPTDERHLSSVVEGSTNIGCAVVESMATLTNDTDPLPSGSIINTVCSSEFPDLMYPNHTNGVPQNELLISDLFLDEDLHFVSLTSNAIGQKRNDKHLDTSNDSVSLTSGQLHSASDYESENRSFSDGPLPNMICNNQQYFPNKPCSDLSEKYACSMNDGKLNFSKRINYRPTNTSGMSGSNFLHHNHSYHLPFGNDESQYRPFIKDKMKSFSEEDICNKDEKRAKELKLPISIHDIINLAIDEYNERLSKYELTDAQLSLIRDIRRRGKNKVAAQNCRKRKMDQISSLQQDLGFLDNEKMQLQSKQNFLIQEKHCFEEKYAQLYDFIFQNSNVKPPNPPTSLLLLRNNKLLLSTNTVGNEDDSESRGSRTRRKFKK